MTRLPKQKAIQVFLVFAFAYFISTVIRAITATLSPSLVAEFQLTAGDLGLLAGGYFFGFALTQIPLGAWLDSSGPKKVSIRFLSIAVVGCISFAMAGNFVQLLFARVLCGVGVSACLMAPLTGYRRWLEPGAMLQANSWMLMVGAFGMVSSTLPVQWVLNYITWRGMFSGFGVAIGCAMLMIYWQAPQWPTRPKAQESRTATQGEDLRIGYSEIWKSSTFKRMAPIGFVNYGGMVAIQTLWAAPWMTKVAGYSAIQTANGLFAVNISMLITFFLWGVLSPWLARNGWSIDRMLTKFIPLSIGIILLMAAMGASTKDWAAIGWVTFCIASTVGAQVQPSVGMSFRPEAAGRALSAFNLVIFLGVFSVQWGIGLLIDVFKTSGLQEVNAYQSAIGIYGLCCLATYINFLRAKKS